MLPLLLALVVRAAIPAGFMLAPDADGHLALVLCSGTGPMLAGAGADASIHWHHHHHHDAPGLDAGGSGSGSSHPADSLCPFAASAAPAPLPGMAAIPLTVSGQIRVAKVEPASAFVSTILRAQQARGPPAAL